MDVGAAVVADEEATALVEPGEAAFHDPAFFPEAGAVRCFAAGDHGCDPAGADEAAVLVVVVAAVGKQNGGSSAWSPGPALHGRHAVEQSGQHERVVAVGTGQEPGQRHPVGVGQEVMLAARAAPVDGAGTDFLAPFFAWIWLLSAAARDQSKTPLAFNSASSSSCR